MIDKLDLRVPHDAQFARPFGRLYAELRASENGPFHPSKHYDLAADLREYGYNVRLSIGCLMDRAGNHKLELIDVGKMKLSEVIREVRQVFVVDALPLGVMRVDFAVDVPDLPLQWFRETVQVQHKRFRSAVTGEPYYSEMGKGTIQTIYFGKRPNVIRIYDKMAEYQDQYRKLARQLGKECKPPTFESVFGISNPDSIVTRVERQIGGRVPAQIGTLRQIIESGFEFKPFAKLKIIDHAPTPDLDLGISFETRCTGLFLLDLARTDGMQAANAFIAKNSNGNASWVRKKYRPFLAASSHTTGITEADLQSRFEQSLARQMAS